MPGFFYQDFRDQIFSSFLHAEGSADRDNLASRMHCAMGCSDTTGPREGCELLHFRCSLPPKRAARYVPDWLFEAVYNQQVQRHCNQACKVGVAKELATNSHFSKFWRRVCSTLGATSPMLTHPMQNRTNNGRG